MIAVAPLLLLTLAGISPNTRAFGQGKYGLELDGIRAGWVTDVHGGNRTYQVVQETGPDFLIKKHLGKPTYQDIDMTVGMGASKKLYEWVKASYDKAQARSGSINSLSPNEKSVVGELDFGNAVLTEFSMPALDAASKDAAKMTIKIKPEYTRFTPSDRKWFGGLSHDDEDFIQSNFSFNLQGMPDLQVENVSRVKVKFPWLNDSSSETFFARVVSNIEIELSEDHAKPLYDWYDSFVVKGNNGDDQERACVIEYRTSSGTVRLFLRGVGIMSVTPLLDDNMQSIRRVKAELYVEDCRFDYTPTSP